MNTWHQAQFKKYQMKKFPQKFENVDFGPKNARTPILITIRISFKRTLSPLCVYSILTCTKSEKSNESITGKQCYRQTEGRAELFLKDPPIELEVQKY